MQTFFQKSFYLDLRSLALFRIGISALILYNLWTLYPQIPVFYSADGVVPLSSVQYWSLHALSDNYLFLISLWIAHAVFALMLMVGFKTRLVTMLCWVMTASLINRAPIIADGADKVMLVFLMWGFFLPLGKRFSIDAMHVKDTLQKPNQALSVGTVAFICQLIFIYLFNAINKSDPMWTTDHTVLQHVFIKNDLVKPLGTWLLQFPILLQWLTVLIRALEMYGWGLLFIPIFSTAMRSIVIVMFIVFHIGIFLTLDLGWFSFIMIVGWIALIPSEWWQKAPIVRPALSLSERSKTDVIAVILLVCVFAINCFDVGINVFRQKWVNIEKITKKINLHQRWSMFAPRPIPFTREAFFEPIFKDKEAFKRYAGVLPIAINPSNDLRWQNFLYGLRKEEYRKYYVDLKSYLMLCWNQEHSNDLQVNDVNIIIKDTPAMH